MGRLRTLVLVTCFLPAACDGSPPCSTRILQVARDPGSDRYATTARRDCGATTAAATVVGVGRAREPQSAATEVFVADDDHGRAGGARSSIWMSVGWTAPGRLSIVYEDGARVFRRDGAAKGAVIAYRAGRPYAPPAIVPRDP